MFLKKKKSFSFRMPSVFAIMLGIMLVIVIVTWIPGVVKINPAGSAHYPHQLGILDVLHATIQGIQTRADVIAFVLAIGAYIGLILKSQALEAGIGILLKKLNGKEIWIIPICIIFFGLGGTIYNMAEETIAYYPILIPVMMFAGFDSITTIMVVTFGAGMGVVGSTIAPFSIVIASGTLSHEMGVNVSAMDGIVWRVIIFVICMAVTIGITMWYANRVKKDPRKSAIFHKAEEQQEAFGNLTELPKFDRRKKAICALFGVTFVLMVLIELPWYTFIGMDPNQWTGDAGQNPQNVGYIAYLLIHYFPYIGTSIFSSSTGGLFIDLATLFFMMTFIIGFIDWKGEDNHIKTVVSGASELLGVAFIISTAGGIAILLNDDNSGLATSIATGLSSAIGHMNAPSFMVVSYLIFIVISFFIPSTSGFAIAILPLFANAAGKEHLSGMVTSFVTAEGFMNLITPAGLPMACLMIAKVDYKTFWKGCWPIILAAFLIPLIMLPLGAAIFQGNSIYF